MLTTKIYYADAIPPPSIGTSFYAIVSALSTYRKEGCGNEEDDKEGEGASSLRLCEREGQFRENEKKMKKNINNFIHLYFNKLI